MRRHVGCGRTRALQHYSRFDSAVRRRKINDGSRESGRPLGRRTHPDSARGKNQSAQWGRDLRPLLCDSVRRRLPTNQSTTLDDDKTALIASASLASDNVRLFGPGGEGVTPILAPMRSTDWDTTIDALGFTINSHAMRISFPHEKVDAIKGYCAISGPRAEGKRRRGMSCVWQENCGTSRTSCDLAGISCGGCCS